MAATFEPTLRGSLPLAGRESHRASLKDAYRDSYNGARIVAFIVGEVGSGRSRLLDELIRDPDLHRSFVVRLRLHQGEENRGEVLLREAVFDALESRPFLRRSLKDLTDLMVASTTSRVALGRMLETIARRVHLVVAIDDLDATGIEGLAPFEDILSGIAGDFMVVATMSPGFDVDAGQLVSYIGAEQKTVRIERLLPEALRDLVHRLFGFVPADDDVEWLFETTLGLPILLREAISSILRTGCVALHGGTWVSVHPFSRSTFTAGEALPSLRRRLEQLPPREREWIAMTAMLGRRAPLEATYSLGLPEGWYSLLVDRELIEVSGKFIEFTHDLLLETAIAEARRLDLHVRLRAQFASLLTPESIERGVRLPATTLRTILATSSDDHRPTMLKSLLSASRELHAREEFQAATVYMDEVRRCWSEVAPALSPEQELRFTYLHSDCLYKTGHAKEQLRLLREGEELVRGEITSPIVARTAIDLLCSLAESEYREKRIDKAEACLERAMGLADILDSDERVRLRDRIAYHRAWSLKSMDRHAEAAQILLEMVARIDPDVFNARAYDTIILLSNLSSYVTAPHASLINSLLHRMLDACERANERRAAMQIRLQLAFELYLRDRHAEFEATARNLLTELHEHLLPRSESNLWFALAVIDADRGEFERALATLDRCIELRWTTRSISMWQLAVISRAMILTGAQRNEEALQAIEMIEEDARRNGRHYRRFLLDISRLVLEARKGVRSGDADEWRRLRAIGNAEEYPAVESRILQVRLERLLHGVPIDHEEAEEVALLALDLDTAHSFDRELTALAAAAVARATVGLRNGRRHRMTAIVDELVQRAETVIGIWREQAPALLRRYVPMFRQHVMPLLPNPVRDRLHMEMERFVALDGGVYDANITAFGRLRVLDREGVERGGRHFGTQKSDSKPRKMLAALVAGAVAGRRKTREQLVDMVWGESTSDDAAGNLFHVTLSGLRQVIGDAIDFDGATYALQTGRLRIDVLDFLKRVEEARSADRDGVSYRTYDLLVDACSLYRGEFLEGIYDEWCEGPREDLRSSVRTVRLRLAELAILRGDHDTARRTIRAMMEGDPADEEAMCLSLRLLDTEGERVRAIREYEEFTRRLRNEYRIAPSRRLQEIREALEAA